MGKSVKKKVIGLDKFKTKPVKYKKTEYLICSEGFRKASGVPGPVIGGINMFLGHSDTGKAQPLSSKVLTPNGFKLMGEIQIGDEVIGSNGNSQNVIGVYPQGERPVYRVTLKDGAVVYCDEEHLWSVNEYKDRHKGTKDEDGIKRYTPDNSFKTMKLKDMVDNVKVKTGKYYSCNYKLPTLAPVNFVNESNLSIDPYVLGVFIGDGSFGKGNHISKITTKDEEIINEVSKTEHFRINHERERLISEGSVDTVRKINSISLTNDTKKSLKSLGLTGHSYTKYIPKNYIYSATITDRINLLQGLMDSDGWVDKRSGTAYFTTTSKRLCDDIIELVNSLGGITKYSSKIPTYTYNDVKKKGRLAHTVSIKLSGIIPFRLSRKIQDYKDNSNISRYIENIEFSHNEECQCIKVSNSDELYVTDNYVLTHNTTALIEAMVASQKKNRLPVIIITEGKWSFSHAREMGFECDEIVDENTGEITYEGDKFLFFDGFRYIEQITDLINQIFDAQDAGEFNTKDQNFEGIDVFWDSVGSIPSKMTYEGKGGTMHDARVYSEKVKLGLARRIEETRVSGHLYSRSMTVVNQPWVDVDMNSYGSQPEIKSKGGEALWLACSLVFLFGQQRSAKVSKVPAQRGNRKFIVLRRTKISVLKNHVDGIGYEDGKVYVSAHGFIEMTDKNKKDYIDNHADYIREKLGIAEDEDFEILDEITNEDFDEDMLKHAQETQTED